MTAAEPRSVEGAPLMQPLEKRLELLRRRVPTPPRDMEEEAVP